MYDRENQMDVESARTNIEKTMMELDPSKTDTERRMYLSGVIDTMAQLEVISDETRGILYAEFCF